VSVAGFYQGEDARKETLVYMSLKIKKYPDLSGPLYHYAGEVVLRFSPYRATINPQRAYHRGYGQDLTNTGKQDVYFIPVEDFEKIY
jgi:hypothetical protein